MEESDKLKKFNYIIGSGTSDHPDCSIIPQCLCDKVLNLVYELGLEGIF
jgi:hypothetical protein